MKRLFKTLAAVLCGAALLFSANSCSEELVGGEYFDYGFDIVGGDPTYISQETGNVEAVFTRTFQQELGVTVKDCLFHYDGSDNDVMAACRKAAQELQGTRFSSSFILTVTKRTAKGPVKFFTWKSY